MMQNRPASLRVAERGLLWVMVLGIGWPASVFVASLVLEYSPFAIPVVADVAVNVIFGGIIIGLTQLLVLRPEVIGPYEWFRKSLVGWISGMGLLLALGYLFRHPVYWILGAALGGGVFGWFQWLSLQPWFTARKTWIIQSAASWLAAYTLGYALNPGPARFLVEGRLTRILEQGLVGWAVLSMVAALIVVIVIPRPKEALPGESREPGPWWPE